ncbi:MAG TPA: zinc metallopeptidase [Chloroflexota bacterium]
MFFDPVYFLFTLPALAFVLYAQWKVKSTYARYAQMPSPHGISGAEVAQLLLRQNGLSGVGIERIPGELTDHYDPRAKVLRLSDSSFAQPSVAALGVVAHECGHAIQDKLGYGPLRVRSALAPAANFGSNVGVWVFIIGFPIHLLALSWVGVALFGLATLFTLVTLPVELDASSRALKMLRQGGFLAGNELRGAEKVLSAAALTYVAALAQSMATLLYFVFRLLGASSREQN